MSEIVIRAENLSKAYKIEGYRQNFIYHEWFWEHLDLTLQYWIFTLAVMFVGAICFKKLRPHFADVL